MPSSATGCVSSDRIAGWLDDIVENCQRIERYVADLTFEEFQRDPMCVDAVERCLQRITEAVIRIGPDAMGAIMPALPVQQVRGLGNVLRHGYDTLSPQIVWTTVTTDLPSLKAACIAGIGERTR